MRTKINNWDLAGDLRRATRACSGGLLFSTQLLTQSWQKVTFLEGKEMGALTSFVLKLLLDSDVKFKDLFPPRVFCDLFQYTTNYSRSSHI